jgi:hypothetical protein
VLGFNITNAASGQSDHRRVSAYRYVKSGENVAVAASPSSDMSRSVTR